MGIPDTQIQAKLNYFTNFIDGDKNGYLDKDEAERFNKTHSNEKIQVFEGMTKYDYAEGKTEAEILDEVYAKHFTPSSVSDGENAWDKTLEDAKVERAMANINEHEHPILTAIENGARKLGLGFLGDAFKQLIE